MRYYILDKDANEKIYLRISGAYTRIEIKNKIKKIRFKIEDDIYHIDDIIAEPSKALSLFGFNIASVRDREQERYETVIANYLNSDKLKEK